MGIRNMTVCQVVTENSSCGFWYSCGDCHVLLQILLQEQQLHPSPSTPCFLAKVSIDSLHLRLEQQALAAQGSWANFAVYHVPDY